MRGPAHRPLIYVWLAFGVAPLLCSSLLSQVTITAHRVSQMPILAPAPAWRQAGVFNPAAAKIDGRTVLLFRAQDANGTSRIGFAESSDGIHFKSDATPVLTPETDYERDGGVEDPRLVKIDRLWYLTYTGYNKHDAQLCLATSHDLKHWQRRGIILPAYRGTWNTGWTKSGAIVPEKIDGRWWMYYLGTRRDPDGKARDYMGLASSVDRLHWNDATKQPVLSRRSGAFDSRVMEPGPPPIITSKGILLLYNGADEHLLYGPGWLLFDQHDPSHLLARSDHAFLLPELDWERAGQVPNVIFLEGLIIAGKSFEGFDLIGYYGAADRYVGAMRIHIAED